MSTKLFSRRDKGTLESPYSPASTPMNNGRSHSHNSDAQYLPIHFPPRTLQGEELSLQHAPWLRLRQPIASGDSSPKTRLMRHLRLCKGGSSLRTATYQPEAFKRNNKRAGFHQFLPARNHGQRSHISAQPLGRGFLTLNDPNASRNSIHSYAKHTQLTDSLQARRLSPPSLPKQRAKR